MAAEAFSALGSPSRVALLRLLVRAGGDGMNVSELREATAIAATTLGHHLRKLADAGLVTQARAGRELRCHANYSTIRAVSAFLMEDCCRGVFSPSLAARCRPATP